MDSLVIPPELFDRLNFEIGNEYRQLAESLANPFGCYSQMYSYQRIARLKTTIATLRELRPKSETPEETILYMNPVNQRNAIAEALGWKKFPYVVINGCRLDVETWISPKMARICTPDRPHGGCYAGQAPPDFPGSLDLMAQAESALTFLQKELYASEIVKLVSPHRTEDYNEDDCGAARLAWAGVYQVATASSQVRAEAFLRVIGKWVGAA